MELAAMFRAKYYKKASMSTLALQSCVSSPVIQTNFFLHPPSSWLIYSSFQLSNLISGCPPGIRNETEDIERKEKKSTEILIPVKKNLQLRNLLKK